MKLSKGIINREDALKISPDYVLFVEGDFNKFSIINCAFEKLRLNQLILTFLDGQFVFAKVSSINYKCIQAVDGPVVRVNNGEYSWRVDGDKYAFPVC